jgi:PAS domain S-box-containing protein
LSKIKNGALTAAKGNGCIRILHVDDDPSILELSKQILMDMGNFEIDHACCVDEAFKKLEQQTYDVIVSDYEMPQKDGLMFLWELRKGKNGIPFVLFTGKGREEVAIKALNLGADGYTNKQGDPETVYGELSHLIKIIVNHNNSEKELWESDIRFAKLASQIPGMLFQFMKRPNGTYCVPFTSDSIRGIFGCSPQDVREDFTPIAKVIVPEDLDKVIRSIEYSAEHLATWQCEYRVQLPGKPIHWLWGQSIPERTSDGSILWNGYNADITERKKTEELLNKNQDQLEAIILNAPIGIATSDSNKCFLSANEVFCTIVGFSEDELRSLTFKDITHPEDSKESIARIEELSSGCISFFSQEKRYIRKDGKVINGKVTVSAIRDKEGKPTLFIAELEDITERKQVEKALAESEAKFRRAFATAPDGFYVSTLKEGKLVEINERFMEIFGYTRQEIIGKTSQQLGLWVNPSDREKMLTQLKSEGEVRNLEVQLIRKNGQVFPAQFSVSFLQAHEQPLLVGVIRDVSSYKQAEEALKESEARYRSLADSLPEVIFEADRDGKLTYANQSAFVVFGYSKEDFAKGLCVFDLMEQNDREKAKENFKKALSNKMIDDDEYTCVRKDGGTFPTIIVSKPIVVENQTAGLRGLVIDMTQRKKNEEALLASEEKYRVTFESTGTAVAIIEEDTTFSLVNNECEKLTGYSKEELEGKKSWTEFVVKEDLDRMKEKHRLRRIDEKAAPMRYEFRFVDRYGEIKNILLTIAMIPGTKKSVASLLDITERKKAEEDLQNSEESLRSLIDSIDDLVFVLDLKGIFKRYHQTKREGQLYVSPEKFVGKHFKDTIPKNVADLFQAAMSRIEASDESQEIVYPMEMQGDTLWYSAKLSPLKDALGKTSSITVVVRNITESKKTEVALRQEQEKLEQATAAVGAGLVIVSKDFHVLWANDFIKRYKGDTIGKLCYATLNSLDAPCPDCGVVKVFAGKTTLDVHEYCSTTIDGNPYWVEISATPITDGKGNVISAAEIAVDITKRKKNEEKIRESIHNNELINEKLRVVGGLTRHDVGNKLVVIASNEYLLRKRLGDKPELAKYLDGIKSAIDNSNKLFEFSRLYEKIGAEKPLKTNVAQCFNQAVALLPNLGAVKVVNECQELDVEADSLLMQFFYNLLDNSLKHGEKVTQIRLHYNKDGDGVKLFYEDNGVGVSEANKQKLFEAGFTTGKGSGLGLNLVKKMVEVYGWQIQETGELGAKFVITIPRVNQSGKENYQIEP